jgi:hypothetical protein
MKIKVFISSPYSIGNQEENVERQIECADRLYNLGFTCFIPLLSHYQHKIYPRVYRDWLDNDLQWLQVCDCLLRLYGESKGADIEEKAARELNIPVFYSIFELTEYYKNRA